MPILFLMFVVFFVLIVLGALFGERGPAREEVLGQLATELDWPLTAEPDHAFGDRFPQFGEFQSGFDRYAHNQMAGEWPLGEGLPPLSCLMGDYHYKTNETRTTTVNGKTQTRTEVVTHDFSYLLVRSPYPTPANLHVRPESFFDRIGAFLGFDDIDFESAEFSRRFHVKSDDKRFAYDVIHPQMMEFLLETQPAEIDLQEGWLCLSSGGRWEPERFQGELNWSAGFFRHWPRHLQSS